MTGDRLIITDESVRAFIGRVLRDTSGGAFPDRTDVSLERRDGECFIRYKLPRSRWTEEVAMPDDSGYFKFEKLVALRDGKFQRIGDRFFEFETESDVAMVRCNFSIDDGSEPRVFADIANPEFCFRVSRREEALIDRPLS